MKRKALSKPVRSLSIAELERMSAEFDRELVADTFGPLTPEMKVRVRRARRKRGRPVVGAGAKAISITIDKALLRKIDALVRHSGTTRSQLIQRGLRTILAEANGRG